MTIEQFDTKKWGAHTKVIYDSVERDVASVDFKEKLVGLSNNFESEIDWVRCENVELITPPNVKI